MRSLETDIIITGSRIRGAPIASSVIVQSQKQMREAGQSTLADVVRAIPQNFGGGQNPGVGRNVPSGSGSNVSAASSINLRGLGSDATLTLVNGHRLAYNAARQSVDISTIPLAAVERIEIVADGASALYGSDAVAGVANIILRRDYNGLTTSARLGVSTDGGNKQQQYSVVGGATWKSGGLIAAYDFERNTPIVARQRSYAASRSPGLTLYPFLRRHSALLSGHQALSANLKFEMDALYNDRFSDESYATNVAGDYRVSGGYSYSKSKSFSVAPSLKLSLSDSWSVSLSASYGKDRSHYGTRQYTAGAITRNTLACYCNNAKSIELAADGTILSLKGGDAKIAVGAGYRSNGFHGTAQDIRVMQDSHYGFGELSLPLVGPDMGIPLVDRLSVSAAVRYEDYGRRCIVEGQARGQRSSRRQLHD